MNRHLSRLLITAIALPLLFAALSAVRASRQSNRTRALDATGAITYFIADGSGKAGYRSADRELALWALEAWQRTTPNALHLEAAAESKALIRLYWADPEGGQYGEMVPLTVAGQRGAAVFIRPDIDSLGQDIARRAKTDTLLRDSIVYLTCLHELGHALGLAHTSDFRDIMYYFGYGGDVAEYFSRYRAQIRSRADIAAVSGLSEADTSRIREMYQPTH